MISKQNRKRAVTLFVIAPLLCISDNVIVEALNKENTDEVTTIYTKSTGDTVGLQESTVMTSKSDKDIESLMEKQVETLKQEKIEEIKRKEEEERIRREEEERIRQEEEQRRQEEERIRQEEEERKKLEASKTVIASEDEAYNIDIRSKSNWTEEDFNKVLPDSMKPVIPVALRLEQEKGINALYLVSVAANEVGWGLKLSGEYNYFNWSVNGSKMLDFSSIQEFSDYSIRSYGKFLDPEFYRGKLEDKDEVPSSITVAVVNTAYAFNPDDSVNWEWSQTVCKIMHKLSDKRKEL